MNEESKITTMNTWNKIQALILMPLYMIVLAFVLYFLASLTFIRAEGIISIVVLPIAFCWIYVPISKKYHFEELYYVPLFNRFKGKHVSKKTNQIYLWQLLRLLI